MLPIISNALVPVFFVLTLGYLAGRFKRVDNQHVAGLNTLVMEYALPASLLAATWHTPRQTLLGQWTVVVALGSVMLGIYALSYLVQRRIFHLGTQEAAMQALTIALPNYASMGLPLVAAVFGPSQIVLVAVALACGSILLSPLTLTQLEVGKAEKPAKMSLWRIAATFGKDLLTPIVFAPLLGVALSCLGLGLPPLLDNSLELIGRTAGGIALFLTGLVLSAQPFKLDANVTVSVLLKNVVMPLATFGVVKLLPMSPEAARTTVILSAISSGFFGIFFGLRYDVRSQQVGSTAIASSVLSALTIAAAIYLTAP